MNEVILTDMLLDLEYNAEDIIAYLDRRRSLGASYSNTIGIDNDIEKKAEYVRDLARHINEQIYKDTIKESD